MSDESMAEKAWCYAIGHQLNQSSRRRVTFSRPTPRAFNTSEGNIHLPAYRAIHILTTFANPKNLRPSFRQKVHSYDHLPIRLPGDRQHHQVSYRPTRTTIKGNGFNTLHCSTISPSRISCRLSCCLFLCCSLCSLPPRRSRETSG